MRHQRGRVRKVIAHVSLALRGRDVVLWAAGLSFFAVLAVVPVLVLALRGAALVMSPAGVASGVRDWARALPDAHGAGEALITVARAALDASVPVLLFAVLPATLYGEGLRRSFNQVLGASASALTGWAGRLGFLPVLVASPVLVVLIVAAAPAVAPFYVDAGWSRVVGVVLSFHLGWVVVSTTVGLVYACTAPRRLPTRTLVIASAGVGAVCTGFLHGFVLFLAIPLDWGVPFAGLQPVGVAVALILWLFVLHMLLLIGYRVALSVHDAVADGSDHNVEQYDGYCAWRNRDVTA